MGIEDLIFAGLSGEATPATSWKDVASWAGSLGSGDSSNYLYDLARQQVEDFGPESMSKLADSLNYVNDRAPAVVTSGVGGGDVLGTLNDYASSASDWLRKNEPLMKWGVPAIGGIASYLSAQDYNKLAQQQRAAINAEKAARMAESKQMGTPRDFTLARQRVTKPMAMPGGMALYFNKNALSMNPSTVRGYANGGEVQQQQFPSEYYKDGELVFAYGGSVDGGGVTVERVTVIPDGGSFDSLFDSQNMARGGYFAGGTKGQDDKVPAMLSDGEFVVDADTVSALGDGNNAAGASALEQMRQNIRKHKRSAPPTKIPPKAKAPEQYLPKGKK